MKKSTIIEYTKRFNEIHPKEYDIMQILDDLLKKKFALVFAKISVLSLDLDVNLDNLVKANDISESPEHIFIGTVMFELLDAWVNGNTESYWYAWEFLAWKLAKNERDLIALLEAGFIELVQPASRDEISKLRAGVFE